MTTAIKPSDTHTPAPWRFELNHCRHAIISPDGYLIALLSANDLDAEDNARLIAAAPELLAALESLVCHVLHYESMPHAHPQAAKNVADARAVIAKAQGGAK